MLPHIRYRYRIVALIIPVLLFSSAKSVAQSSTEDSIKAVIRAETTTFYKRDADAWKATWVQDNKTTRTFAANNGYNSVKGWENFGPMVIKYLKDNPKEVPVKVTAENFIIHNDVNIAWVEYDQVMTGEDTAVRHSREQRALVNQDGKWKIVSQVTYETDSYANTSQAVENNLNTSGYALLEMGKIENAIDVFILNTKLFPDSWNTYDSLGEAYAKAGKKDLAIENYEKSVKMNPANDNGKKALETLRK